MLIFYDFKSVIGILKKVFDVLGTPETSFEG